MGLQPKLGMVMVTVLLLFSTTTQGVVFNQNIGVENGDGFLVNPILPTLYPVDSQSVEREQFYIYNQNTATKVTAQFGNLKAEQNISYKLNDYDYSNADPLSLKVVNVDGGANITAHLVETTVTNTKPNLKILVHSDRRLEYDRCVRIFAKRSNSETVSETCILKSGVTDDSSAVICMATVPLPYEWWSSRDIDVYFDVQTLEVCTSTSNYLPSYNLPDDAFYVGEVVLMFDDRHGAKEIMEDANLGLSVPDKAQQPGEEFSVMVKLYPGSLVDLFFVRVELGDGLLLKSVNSSDPTRWSVRAQRAGSSMVDIQAVALTGAVPSLKVQEVIRCTFEVSKSTIKLQANIRWTFQYMKQPTSEKNEYEKSVITRINFSKADQVAHLVAVLKSLELVSLRQFSNAVSTIPVWLYAIDRSGKISLVNSRSNCKSTRSSILEVSKQCDMIYLSGEGSDPGIVEVTFDYNGKRRIVDVRVWYPDVLMSIKLTDDRLSEIKGWKLKTETNQVGGRDSEIECNLQYQNTDVKVYTKFYTVQNRRDVYMRGGKVEVFADITPHVKHLIQSSNRDVVQYEYGQLRGVGPGKAFVKVVNAFGSTLAATEVKVTSSKTEIDRISGNFFSDINMVVSESDQQGLLVATYSYERALSDKLAEGVLELWLHFIDGKVVPLSSFDQQSYSVEIENQTPTILALPSNDFSSRYITVRAVGSGRGVLKYTLRMDPTCQRKSTRYLAEGYAFINSQLSKPAGLFVNDAAYKSEQRNVLIAPEVKPKSIQKFGSIKKPGKPAKYQPSIGKTDRVQVDTRKGNQGGGVTPLETGMFVLMGVLGVVASVFVTNCLVYTYRQQKSKQTGDGGKLGGGSDGCEKVDSGWVWLNRNTLQENAINTNPEQFLSERDFEKRCSRSDSMQSTRSKKSSTGTYKGSECSIRITVNPRNILNLPDLSDSEEDELFLPNSTTQPIINIEEPELSDIGGDDDEFSVYSLKSKRRQSAESSGSEECQQSFIVHENCSADDKPTNLTQEEFDNLRESVA